MLVAYAVFTTLRLDMRAFEHMRLDRNSGRTNERDRNGFDNDT